MCLVVDVVEPEPPSVVGGIGTVRSSLVRGATVGLLPPFPNFITDAIIAIAATAATTAKILEVFRIVLTLQFSLLIQQQYSLNLSPKKQTLLGSNKTPQKPKSRACFGAQFNLGAPCHDNCVISAS
jgi:hypothetical protein